MRHAFTSTICDSAVKQRERETRITELAPAFHEALTEKDRDVLQRPVKAIVSGVQNGSIDPHDVLLAYSKQALAAHAATNCLTEVMIAEAESKVAQGVNRKGPLAGMPVSLKDTAGVAGWDSAIGFSAWVHKPVKEDSALVRLLRDAGAVPFVKTNIPITLLSFESASDLFGATTNPHKATHSPGGSSGGEAALLAYGGSRIGIGTDVAGSVRVPAHYSGVYTVKASMNRFLKTGGGTSIAGQEGVPAVYSPMTRTLEDLETFWKAIFSMEPWKYDHTVLPLPWRNIDLSNAKTLKWGVMWTDGVVTPSPACERALREVVTALQAHGHQVVAIDPPSPYEALKVASQLLLADAGKTAVKPMVKGESNDPGVRQALLMFKTPRWMKHLYAWYLRHIRGDELYAGLIETWHEKTVAEFWALVAQREDYRKRWFDMWTDEELDFVLTVPNALPAVPHGGMKEGFKSCGYTFLFNLLDYAAGVLPITHVDRSRDALPPSFKAKNAIEAGAYKAYDVDAMHGLPIGVQVVGRRLEEEKVLEGMKIVQKIMVEEGKGYNLLNA
ncbi:hypothetical protein PLICRDRAFT_355330 [Plicaturopsis crispa FD-325 SS-3]|uniref:amidase n=1 Tax=Plicaturopsis crispa FD-325 SS-3 TaxID=944288 RepID=A0A0C9T8S1_PLICR|nr:hypothetical protein PLICRDRAFT_355330 [Plicaturopsis crispa FD-325 SS-3]